MKNIKKILFVSHDVNRAGAQLFILSIMKYFKQKDIEIVLLAINDWGTLKDEFCELFPVYFLNNSSVKRKKSFFGKQPNSIEEIKKLLGLSREVEDEMKRLKEENERLKTNLY